MPFFKIKSNQKWLPAYRPQLIPFLGICQSYSIYIDGLALTHPNFLPSNWCTNFSEFIIFQSFLWMFFSSLSPKENVYSSVFSLIRIRWPLQHHSITFYGNYLLSLYLPHIFQILRAESTYYSLLFHHLWPSAPHMEMFKIFFSQLMNCCAPKLY